MAYQLRGGRGVAWNLNPLPPERGEQAPPPAAEVDRISSLPEEAQLRILGFLPLKAAVKLGMASKRWSRLVSRPQWPCDSILGIHIRPATRGRGPCDDDGCALATHVRSDQIVPLLANDLGSRGRGPGPGHRLLRFFLRVEDAQTRPADFYSLLDYAAECDVEDAVVDAVLGPPEVSFNFWRASHRLLRLVLFGVGVGIGVDEALRPGSQVRAINTLQIICIRHASVGDLDLKRLLLSCPRLRTLILRDCRVLTFVDVTAASKRLVNLTVAECPQVDKISVSTALGLRSFSYSGAILRSVALPQTCFGDLYICFTKPSTVVDPIQYHSWLDALPKLTYLVNLTICSNALRIMSVLRSRGNFQPQVAKLSNLRTLRELQLVLYKMNTVMLSDIYGFLKMCRCSRLRNLFLELPKARTDSYVDAVSGSAEQPPMDGFKRLVEVKITNFKWQCNEIELVHFLFRKARSLQKLILVVPEGTNPERDQSGNAIFPDLSLLRLEKAPRNVKVQVLSEFFGSKVKAVHREIFFSN